MGNPTQCPKCRGYNVKRKWCDVCDGKGSVESDKRDMAAETDLQKSQSDDEKVYIVNGREQKERPRCVVLSCDRFADAPWTTCQAHWR